MSPSDPPPTPQARARQMELVRRLIGKKVIVSTTGLHYVVGRLVRVDDDETLCLTVNDRPVLVRKAGLVRIQEADVAQAEYVK